MTAATIRCGAYPKAVDAYRNGFFLSARRRRGCLRNRPRGNLSELPTCDDYQVLQPDGRMIEPRAIARYQADNRAAIGGR